jgi:hypothetical protein
MNAIQLVEPASAFLSKLKSLMAEPTVSSRTIGLTDLSRSPGPCRKDMITNPPLPPSCETLRSAPPDAGATKTCLEEALAHGKRRQRIPL